VTSAPPPPEGSGPIEHPRERLLAYGAESLSTQELLSLLVADTDGQPARSEHADRLLSGFGTLRALGLASAHELERKHGLGSTTALRLTAALALGRRLQSERVPRGRLLKESGEIFRCFHARLRDLRKERFIAVLLDAKNRVIREDQVSEGILTASLVHPREVFAPAMREAAAGLVLVHNHPSGDPEPSPEDHEVTHRLCAVGELVGIRILDHVVIGDGRYVSFLERGLIPG
jgi:DNA repair protein RadC